MKSVLNRVLALCLAAASGIASSQTYPTQRVTLIVPFAPGGPTDGVARVVAQELERSWKQPVIVDNRPGANGMIGASHVARQPADGQTLLVQNTGLFSIRLFVKEPPVNTDELRPVASVAQMFNVAVAHPSLGAKNLKEFIALAKQRPKALNVASSPASTLELDHHLFSRLAGVELALIGYTSGAPMLQAALRNEVQFWFANIPTAGPHIKEGKLVALAYLGPERHRQFPDVPTAREQGIDYTYGTAYGIIVHAKTPEDIVRQVGASVVAAAKQPEVAARLNAAGFDVPRAPLNWVNETAAEVKSYTEMARSLSYQPQ
jgi:tripartite-type tricarboxylate transporter receptor subunit TctC